MPSEATMRALVLTAFDTEPTMMDVAAPEPAAGELLVRVRAASVNAYDVVVAGGMMRDYLPYAFPAVIGQDVAGVVERVGADVDGFRTGDRVFGTLGMKAEVHDGTFAELSTPQASALAPTPEGLDDHLAGSLGVAGTTAMSAVDAVDAGPEATVLIVGATGGVGSFAVQLAAARGARVIASIRPGDEAFVTELGAAETADYSEDLLAAIRERYPAGVDALIDLVHRDPDAFASHVGVVRDGGRGVSVVGAAGESASIGGAKVANVGSDPSHLGPLATMVRSGSLTVPVRSTYPLADAARALRDFTDGHTLGKLVVTVDA
jgi:NADPH:quinone reductase-like Zn-dependent oxidoreductase